MSSGGLEMWRETEKGAVSWSAKQRGVLCVFAAAVLYSIGGSASK